MAVVERLFLKIAAATAALIASPTLLAQAPDTPIAPVEVLTCRFAEGKGPQDIDTLTRAFNQWMEENSAPEYAAYVAFPTSHSEEIAFDLAWIGAWPDGTTMGQSMAHYFEHGDELVRVFSSVMDCGTNTNFSAVTVRAPATPGRFGPLEVGTCTLRLGAVLDDALQAASEWVEYTATVGSTAAHWLLFPAYGEHSEATYSFKWAVGYESYEAFGREYDQATNGNGLDRYNELFADLLRCDSPRLYRIRSIRAPHG